MIFHDSPEETPDRRLAKSAFQEAIIPEVLEHHNNLSYHCFGSLGVRTIVISEVCPCIF